MSHTIEQEEARQARAIHGGRLNCWGAGLAVRLSRLPIPTRALRGRLFRILYGKKYPALDEQELEQPMEHYRSLNALFTRGLPPGVRNWSNESHVIDAPCDSTVQDSGPIDGDTILTAKGIPYTLESLMPETDSKSLHGGSYTILFLSPADCHRVFAPIECELTGLTHVPGSRLLVHPPFQTAEFPVFALNERVIIHLNTAFGKLHLIMVAGWGVGHITHPFPHTLAHRADRISTYSPPSPVQFRRGEWIATFELGSTVIVLAEPGADIQPNIAVGVPLKMGTPLMSLARYQPANHKGPGKRDDS